MYADDISVLVCSHHPRTVSSYLKSSLEGLTRWAERNDMSFSPNKSGYINLSRRRTDIPSRFYLHHQPIQKQKKLKILGLWLQENLKWSAHLQYIQTRTLKRLALLRMIGGPRWGLSEQHLLQIVTALIIPVLTYAALVTFAAPAYFRVGIERLHSAALRICMGVPRQTPLTLLRYSSGTLDLANIIRANIIRFCIRHCSLGADSPIQGILTDREALAYYRWRPTEIPIRYFLLQQERAGKVDVTILRNSKFYATAYLQRDYKITVRSLPFQDKALPSNQVVGMFTEYINTIPAQTTLIGTDASHSHNKSAIGMSSSTGISLSLRVREEFSVFSAEALAILETLRIFTQTISTLIIFSDSLSVLTALKKIHRRSHTLILEIHHTVQAYVSSGGRVQMIWVPSHTGIRLNEQADREAYKGLGLTVIENFPLPWTDIFHTFKDKLRHEYIETWNTSIYKKMFPFIQPMEPWNFPKDIPRRAEILLRKLYTNTLAVNANLACWGRRENPFCELCGKLETTTHYMLECLNHQTQRNQLFIALQLQRPVTLPTLLEIRKDPLPHRRLRALWNFIKNSKRFYN